MLSQILPSFLYPIGLVLICLACIFVLASRSIKLSRAFTVLAFLLLFFSSNRYIADQLLWQLEKQFDPLIDDAKADVIVVLGGITRPHAPYRQVPEIGEGGDRLTYAAKLYKEGVAPLILVTGGRVGSDHPEADIMADFLMMLGVPEQAIIREVRSKNTLQNAAYSKDLMLKAGLGKTILVTSAAHMRRASRIFQYQQIEHLPAPTDYRTQGLGFSWQADILPQARYLEKTTSVMKEHLGYWYLLLKGY